MPISASPGLEVVGTAWSRLSTPRAHPTAAAEYWGIGAMAVLAAIDIATSADIRLHVLYLFPLAAIAFHSGRLTAIWIAVAVAVTLQLLTFYTYDIRLVSIVTDSIVTVAASLLTVGMAHHLRVSMLAATKLATTDWLTDLPNRRSFEGTLETVIARQQRYGGIFSLAFIDIDDFKIINDSRGHQGGDEVLRILAHTLRQRVRAADTVARIGGDEFAILMPETGTEDCGLLCRELSAHIAQKAAQASFQVTVSMGYATFVAAPESSTVAARRADSAMYRAKSHGNIAWKWPRARNHSRIIKWLGL